MYNNGYLYALSTEFSIKQSGYIGLHEYSKVRNLIATKIEQKYNVTLTLNEELDIITVTYND